MHRLGVFPQVLRSLIVPAGTATVDVPDISLILDSALGVTLNSAQHVLILFTLG